MRKKRRKHIFWSFPVVLTSNNKNYNYKYMTKKLTI